jgi:SulP family sulfate permease
MCSAINAIDMSALESLEAINERLCDMGVSFHLSEIKGPGMDQLVDTDLLKHLTGEIFLSQKIAVDLLSQA